MGAWRRLYLSRHAVGGADRPVWRCRCMGGRSKRFIDQGGGMRQGYRAVVVVSLLTLGVSGCATRDWVREMVGKTDQRVGSVEERTGAQGQRIEQVEGRVNEESQRVGKIDGKVT